jgi:hypothetical protein
LLRRFTVNFIDVDDKVLGFGMFGQDERLEGVKVSLIPRGRDIDGFLLLLLTATFLQGNAFNLLGPYMRGNYAFVDITIAVRWTFVARKVINIAGEDFSIDNEHVRGL